MIVGEEKTLQESGNLRGKKNDKDELMHGDAFLFSGFLQSVAWCIVAPGAVLIGRFGRWAKFLRYSHDLFYSTAKLHLPVFLLPVWQRNIVLLVESSPVATCRNHS